MDTTDPGIAFDGEGVCRHCREYERHTARRLPSGEDRRRRREALVADIRARGRGREYDCVIGLSGGVDSSYLAHETVRLGLRPLAVHLDNGWNSELAVGNIERIVRTLRIDLHTHVIDWEEFRDLQLAFLRASVVDVELLTDQAIGASIYGAATARGIRTFLSGVNLATESLMPPAWYYANKLDSRHVRAIWRRFGSGRPLRTYPLLTLPAYCRLVAGLGFRTIPFLDYLDYDKEAAKELMKREFRWIDYGGKHYESRFTKFYQAYILPRKFGIDKRRAHLSNLVQSGQITREQALERLGEPLYTERESREDREYIAKKLGISTEAFDAIMRLPPRDHREFPGYDRWTRLLGRLKSRLS